MNKFNYFLIVYNRVVNQVEHNILIKVINFIVIYTIYVQVNSNVNKLVLNSVELK